MATGFGSINPVRCTMGLCIGPGFSFGKSVYEVFARVQCRSEKRTAVPGVGGIGRGAVA